MSAKSILKKESPTYHFDTHDIRIIREELSLPIPYKIIYFKESGKYFSEGEFIGKVGEIWHVHLSDLIDELKRGNWPGLITGWHDYDVLFDATGIPHLIKNQDLIPRWKK